MGRGCAGREGERERDMLLLSSILSFTHPGAAGQAPVGSLALETNISFLMRRKDIFFDSKGEKSSTSSITLALQHLVHSMDTTPVFSKQRITYIKTDFSSTIS